MNDSTCMGGTTRIPANNSFIDEPANTLSSDPLDSTPKGGGGTRNKLSFKKRISTHYYSWGDTHNKLDESIDINNNSNHKHNLVLTSKLVQS